MKFFDRFGDSYSQIEKPVKEMLGRLSSSQRLSLAILGVTVLTLLGLVIASSPSDVEREIKIKDDEGGLVKKHLVESSIPFEHDGGYLVVSGKHMGEVSSIYVENPSLLDEPKAFQWLWGETSWSETSGQRQEKVFETKRQMIVKAIESTSGILNATVHTTTPGTSTFVTSKRPSTAAVYLTTDSSLSSKKANGIRTFVAYSLGILVKNVTVHDDGVEVGQLDGIGMIDESKNSIKAVTGRNVDIHLRARYSPSSYTYSVDVKVNRSKRVVETKSYDADKSASLKRREVEEKETNRSGARAPGVQPNVAKRSTGSGVTTVSDRERTEVDFDTGLGTENAVEETPAGEVKKVSILVSVSISAIKQALRQAREEEEGYVPTSADIEQHVASLQEYLANISAAGEVNVIVNAVTMRTSAAMPVAIGEGEAVVAFLQLHGREIALAVLSLFGCFMLFRSASRSVPEMETLPDPVADLQRFLQEKEERDRIRAQELESMREEKKKKDPVTWEAKKEDQEAMELLRAVAEFAAERPDLAANVMRNWMNETIEKNPLQVEDSELDSEGTKS